MNPIQEKFNNLLENVEKNLEELKEVKEASGTTCDREIAFIRIKLQEATMWIDNAIKIAK